MGAFKWVFAGVAAAGLGAQFTSLVPFGKEAGLGGIAIGGAGFLALSIIEK